MNGLGYPKYGKSQSSGKVGESFIDSFVHQKLGWIYRSVHQESDFGIDGYIDIVTDENVTGQTIGIQIKCGDSYFNKRTGGGIRYEGENKHLNYYLNCLFPIVLVVLNGDCSEGKWVEFNANITSPSKSGWWIEIPDKNALDMSVKDDWELLIPAYVMSYNPGRRCNAMRPSGSPEVLEQRRRRGIALLKEGYPPVEVARRIGVDRRSVRRWKAAYRKHGETGIQARAAPGRPAALAAKDKKRLEKILLRGAKAAGFPTDLWTCPRVAQLIWERFGVDYHVDHVGRLLHGLGFSPQKPARRAIERDEAEIQRWLKERWPRVKKTPRA